MKRARKTLFAVCLVGVLGASSIAFAGMKYGYNVYIRDGYAFGTAGAAHNSSDSTQYIHCTVYAWPGQQQAYCSARNSAGDRASCATWDADLIAAAQSVQGDSYMLFRFDDTGGCTHIMVTNGSTPVPK